MNGVRDLRVGAQLHPQHGDWPRLRQAALEAEELGYDALFTWDHFFPLYGDADDLHLECWTVLAAWAEATRRIELGPLVTCTSYRNPDLLADMARTVDRISGGRLILGMGAGWFERDYAEYGYDFGTPRTRLDALGAALTTVEARLARLRPPPLRPVPILIGGVGQRRTLRLVARHAAMWHAMFPERPDEILPAVEALRRWCGELGRDPQDVEWWVGVEPDDVDRFLEHDAERYLELGFTGFTLGFNGPDWTVSRGREWLSWRDERNALP